MMLHVLVWTKRGREKVKPSGKKNGTSQGKQSRQFCVVRAILSCHVSASFVVVFLSDIHYNALRALHIMLEI